jgi:hypothetical protein
VACLYCDVDSVASVVGLGEAIGVRVLDGGCSGASVAWWPSVWVEGHCGEVDERIDET